MAAANIAFAGKNAMDAIKAGQGQTITDANGTIREGQIVTKTNPDGSVAESHDATAADKSGGINLSISIGSSSSQSKTTQTSDSARESTVAAGNNLNITASGAGQDSDITAQGSSLQAGNRIALNAQDEIRLLAAKNTAEQHSTNASKSGSVGISIGTNGLLFTVSASGARGNADGSDVTWTNTHVNAGNQVTLQSAGDTTMKGAVISGKQVTANIGGDLNIESLQDTSQYDSKQQSIGGSISIGYGKVGGSFSASKSKVDSNFASVTEQSGIKAGDGGFNVNVQGDTDLKGGAIASTQQAIDDNRNNFSTGGELTTSDIQNQASYKASSVGVSIGTGGKLAPQGSSAGIGKDSGNASSTTQAAISGIAGNKDARTGDAETGIAKIFDADKVQKDINAQVQITQAFGREAPRAVASFAASKIDDIKTQQKAEAGKTDPNLEKLQTLKEEQQKWEEGGAYRVALHTATGVLASGAQGALGAGAVAGTAPLLDQLQQNVQSALTDAGANETLAKAAGQLVAQGAAAGIGGAISGSAAGAAMGFNVDANNRQLHPSEEKWVKDKAKAFAKKEGITEKEALERLTQQALKDVDYRWRVQLTDGDDAAAKAYLASAKQTFTNDLGEQQRFFTVAGQQLFRPEMFADSADPAFYKQFAQSGISRSLSTGLTKELKDSGIALKDGTIDLLKAAKDNPGLVLDALWSATKGLPGAAVDSFRETGTAIGEGGAVALNEDINAKLNAIYGTDVEGYQKAILAIRTLSAIGGAAGMARAGTGLGEEAAKAVGRKLDEELIQKLALKNVQVGAIHGFKNADEVNSLMSAYSYAPAWKSGTQVAETTLQPGTRVQMVVDEITWNAIRDGKTERSFGGWATFDNVPNQAYARNQLAITNEFKQNVGYVIEVEITKPIQAQVGVVGSQGGAAGGGGNQLNFLISRDDRSSVFKYVQGSGRALP